MGQKRQIEKFITKEKLQVNKQFANLCYNIFMMIPPIVAYPISGSTITQGTSTSVVNVQTTSNGNVTTHIETNVNGNDQIYNSSESGSVHIENTGNSYSVTVSPASSNAAVIHTPAKIQISFWTNLKNFLKNIFKFF